MMQQANLSDKNAFCRFALGTSITAFGIARVSRNPNCMRGRLMIALGAMKMAEGVFKYCPSKAMLKLNAENAMNSMFSGTNSMSSEQITNLMKDFSSTITGNSSETTAKPNASDTSTSTQNSSDSKNSTNKAQNPS